MDQHRVMEGVKSFKKNGIRITPQRMAIMEYLATTESHPTADEIFKSLTNKFPNMSNGTVYNNLKCLKKYGFIKELSFGQSSSRYEWKTSFHYHVICTSCGKMRDFNYPELKEVEQFAKIKSGFEVSRHLFEIHGICPDCHNKTQNGEMDDPLLPTFY
ncbi:transcriptional repressor [Fictibacillus sp. WQ 8-8]|uniref:Fur family transcriptional regulator n=1 Tax=Fictibacillus sp. WQ 8-8 TaxID=2938788 RepID=UPI00210B9D5B|nr:Fur family transcriptional regulator [Fictibacillus sp. WQ 8-8]MCQ6267796.1 transcriptional repressor [Fictibacillus sp. WQ 8-8]